MHVSLETLRLHIDYSEWASRRILAAAESLEPEELTRDFETADKSVLGTLLHICGGDLVWIERIDGRSLTARPYDASADLAWLRREWPKSWHRYRDYVARLDETTAKLRSLTTISKATRGRRLRGRSFCTWSITLRIIADRPRVSSALWEKRRPSSI